MTLHRYILRPLSSWGTPLRSDTLSGLLLYRVAEDEGESVLKALLEGFMQGKPPFVLSSAMPQNCVFAPKLPPISHKSFDSRVRRGDITDGNKQLSKFEALSLFKKFRKNRYLPLAVWERHKNALSQEQLFVEFCQNPDEWKIENPKRHQEMHVTIDRRSNSALEGGLYVSNVWWPQKEAAFHLYAKTDDGSTMLERLKRLGEHGIGRDSSTGKGVFSVEEDTTFVPPEQEKGSCGLLISTLSAMDMRGLDGWYAVDVKCGKVGPAFSHGNPYKSPFLCVQEGALLTSVPKGPYVLTGLNANPAIVQVTEPLLLPCAVRKEEDNA